MGNGNCFEWLLLEDKSCIEGLSWREVEKWMKCVVLKRSKQPDELQR